MVLVPLKPKESTIEREVDIDFKKKLVKVLAGIERED